MDSRIKRVLFVVTQSEMGGAQRFVFEMLKFLSKGSYELLLAVGKDGDASLNRMVSELGVEAVTLTSLRRNINPFKDITAVKETLKLINSFEPDTIFLNSSKAGFIGSLAAKFANHKLKVIYRIGGWSFNDNRPRLEKWLWVIAEKISARWKDYIIVNNKADYEQAKRLGIKPRREIIVIHNGIDPYKINFLTRDEARIKLLNESDRNKNIVGTIANLYPVKGLEIFIRAAALDDNDNALYLIIGDGAERKKLEQLIIDLDLKHKVLILGRLENAAQYLPAFDIFVLASHKEGFPWAVLEAMSAKLPVIATSVGAIPEIIKDDSNGLIVPAGNPEVLAEKIHLLMSNNLLANTLSVQGHQTVVLKFSLERMISQIEDLL